MKRLTFFKTCAFTLSVAATVFSYAGTAHAQKVRWNHDVNSTYALSQKSGKPMLIIVGASWCPACRNLQAYTLGDPQFKRAAQKWECAHLDADGQQNVPFMAQLGIREIPAIVMVSPQGQPFGKIVGYVGAGELAQALNSSVKPYLNRPVAKVAVPRASVAKTAKALSQQPARQPWTQMAEVKNARSQPNYGGVLLLTEDGAVPLDAPKPIAEPTAKKTKVAANKQAAKNRVK